MVLQLSQPIQPRIKPIQRRVQRLKFICTQRVDNRRVGGLNLATNLSVQGISARGQAHHATAQIVGVTLPLDPAELFHSTQDAGETGFEYDASLGDFAGLHFTVSGQRTYHAPLLFGHIVFRQHRPEVLHESFACGEEF